jgi:hypothetical protein
MTVVLWLMQIPWIEELRVRSSPRRGKQRWQLERWIRPRLLKARLHAAVIGKGPWRQTARRGNPNMKDRTLLSRKHACLLANQPDGAVRPEMSAWLRLRLAEFVAIPSGLAEPDRTDIIDI